MLEYLTYDDIKNFVTSRFLIEPVFMQLRRREEEFADQLIDDIVSKAAGVFLWVALVVSSLLAGMTFGDRVSDLKRRLDLLPPDLSKLYEKMLLSLDPFYLEHAAQLFSLVGASSEPMNLVLASFADEDDPDFALKREICPLSRDEIALCMDTMRRRINSRSKGLLEVKGLVSTPEGVDYDPRNFESCTVQYLHRTVKDYIEDDDVQKTLKSAMRSTFDPHLRLLAGRLASMKGMNLRGTLPAFMSEHFIKCLESARVVLPSNIPKMILLLDEMKKIGSLTFPALVANRRIQEAENSIPLPTKYDSWDFWLMSSLYLDLEKAPSGIDDAFLSLAVVFGIVEYVRIKVGLGCLIQKRDFLPLPDMPRYVKWPLLMDVITLRGFGIGDSRHHVLALPMIQCLLDKGADPNYKVSRPYHSHETSPLIESVSLLMSSVDYWKLRQPWVEGRRLQFWVEVPAC